MNRTRTFTRSAGLKRSLAGVQGMILTDSTLNPGAITVTLTTNETTILDSLNNYTGDNLWQDVIYGLLTSDEWDAASDTSDEFTHEGVSYRFEPSIGEWITVTLTTNEAVAGSFTLTPGQATDVAHHLLALIRDEMPDAEYEAGQVAGYEAGYRDGFEEASEEAYAEAYLAAYDKAYDEGFQDAQMYGRHQDNEDDYEEVYTWPINHVEGVE